MSKPRRFTSQTVSQHNRPDDCWLIICGKVYDVTSWVPHHPGGSLIHLRAGQDCTQLFDSYHPLYVRKLLARYYIGEVEKLAGEEPAFTLEYDNAGGEEFYLTVKQRVETHFRTLNVNPRMHSDMFIKSFLVIAGYLCSYYTTFFGLSSFWLSLLAAVVTGFMAAEVGLSIQHDANHGSYSRWPKLSHCMSVSLDLVGASSFMWRQQHDVGHHSFTNVNNYDPDIRVKDPDVRRITSEQPKRFYHRYQHLYLGVLYGLLALKSIFLDDFSSWFCGSIGSVKLPKMTLGESVIFWGGKLFYATYMIVVPAIFSHHSTVLLIILYVVTQLVAGWVLALFFQVAHVVDAASFPTVVVSDGTHKIKKGWAALQVSTTTNFSTNSIFWTHLTGGLNFQIEHHLFPAVCHLHYPSIQHIVKETCDEFNVPYKSYPSFWVALKAHFDYLRTIGVNDFNFHLDG